MISPLALVSVFCITVYLVSTTVCIGIFVAGGLKEVAQKRALQRRSGRLPCGNCHYFTGEAWVKCAVHPVEALTDAALNCRDFETKRR